jgi:hypothetical protein
MAIPRSFDGIWWSVEVPPGWHARGDEECATFQGTPFIGAFQISSAHNETSPITDADVEEFALGRIPEGVRLVQVKYGQFWGLTACFQKDDLVWREWWLRSGRLMIYATYNVAAQSLDAAVKEQADVESMLATLKPKGNAS